MKEIKLIKVGRHYDLYHRIAEEDLIIGFASTDNTFEKKLSFKNCQVIEQQFPTQRMWDVEFDIDILDAEGCLILKKL
jgi:hypothetical protein